MTILSNASEDFTKRTFDFWNDDGSQVSDLRTFAVMVAMGLRDAATVIALYPHPEALPDGLLQEAQDELDR